MSYSPDELLKLIHETRALSIWDRKKGPVFWYIAGVPGPFYVNTELLIGDKLAGALLAKIDDILAHTSDNAARAAQLEALVTEACANTPVYRDLVATMIERAKKEFPANIFTFISGGERRDWLFSIPFAKELCLKHIYMFKNKTLHCAGPLQAGETGLHVSDLINNAVSYTDMWLPMLEKAKLSCAGTVSVISRGEAGLKALEAKDVKVAALNTIDLSFFERSQANNLISTGTLAEIACHFASPREWALAYLIDKPDVFAISEIDKKSFERLKSFFVNDPWSLRAGHEAFFKAMQDKIVERIRDRI